MPSKKPPKMANIFHKPLTKREVTNLKKERNLPDSVQDIVQWFKKIKDPKTGKRKPALLIETHLHVPKTLITEAGQKVKLPVYLKHYLYTKNGRQYKTMMITHPKDEPSTIYSTLKKEGINFQEDEINQLDYEKNKHYHLIEHVTKELGHEIQTRHKTFIAEPTTKMSKISLEHYRLPISGRLTGLGPQSLPQPQKTIVRVSRINPAARRKLTRVQKVEKPSTTATEFLALRTTIKLQPPTTQSSTIREPQPRTSEGPQPLPKPIRRITRVGVPRSTPHKITPTRITRKRRITPTELPKPGIADLLPSINKKPAKKKTPTEDEDDLFE